MYLDGYRNQSQDKFASLDEAKKVVCVCVCILVLCVVCNDIFVFPGLSLYAFFFW